MRSSPATGFGETAYCTLHWVLEASSQAPLRRDRWYSSVGAVSDATVKKYLNDLKVPVPPATGWVASGLYGPCSFQS